VVSDDETQRQDRHGAAVPTEAAHRLHTIPAARALGNQQPLEAGADLGQVLPATHPLPVAVLSLSPQAVEQRLQLVAGVQRGVDVAELVVVVQLYGHGLSPLAFGMSASGAQSRAGDARSPGKQAHVLPHEWTVWGTGRIEGLGSPGRYRRSPDARLCACVTEGVPDFLVSAAPLLHTGPQEVLREETPPFARTLERRARWRGGTKDRWW